MVRRRLALRQLNRKESEIWVTNFHSKIMSRMEVEAISSQREVHTAFPAAIMTAFGPPVVCWKYATPAGLKICSEKVTSLNAHKTWNKQCQCHLVPNKFKDKSGHVVTTNLDIVDNDEVRKLMKARTTFRHEYLPMHFDTEQYGNQLPEELLALDHSITECIERCAELHELPTYMFNDWANVLMTKLKEKYEEVTATMAAMEDSEEYLKKFHHKYAIIT